MPEVSIVIPAHNAARYVGQAIESVLGQTFGDNEVILVDDGSTDDTASVIEGFGSEIRQIRQANSGVSVARNRGIAESTGRYVAFLDADDTWMPEKLARQLDALRRQPGHGLAYSALLVTDSELQPLEVRHGTLRGSALETLLLHGNVVGGGSNVL